MGSMGNEVVQTPNLDRLASEGVLFTHGFSCSPLCSPDRACLVTGLYPHTHGVVQNNIQLRTSIPTIADVLKSDGYATGYIGKWHLDGTGKPGFVPLDRARNVEIHIHDAAGQLQKKLSLGAKPAGVHTSRQSAAYWDGRNQFGEVVATGVYFYTLRAGEFWATRKMTVRR